MCQVTPKLHLALVLLSICIGCDGKGNGEQAPEASEAKAKAQPRTPDISEFQTDWSVAGTEEVPSEIAASVEFTQSQNQLGVKHRYENGDQGKAYLVETIGGGCGWLDFDLDGRPDLYVNQGGHSTKSDRSEEPSDALSQNVSDRFENVSEPARIDERLYSQGVAVGDFNNDGFEDVYVSNVGKNTFWMNCGDGTFIEIWSSVQVKV